MRRLTANLPGQPVRGRGRIGFSRTPEGIPAMSTTRSPGRTSQAGVRDGRRERRMLNAYRRISLFGQDIQVPHVPLREEVDIHMVPDAEAGHMELRIWWNDHMVHSLTLPLEGFSVQF